MDKNLLLDLLDDVDVQRKIFRLVDGHKTFAANTATVEEISSRLEESSQPPEQKNSSPENFSRTDEVQRLKGQLRTLADEKSDALKRATTAESQLESLRTENSLLKNSLAKVQQQVKDLNRQIQTTQYENSRLSNSLSQAQRQAKNFKAERDSKQILLEESERQTETYWQQLTDAQKEISRLESSVDELNAQLQQNFSRGRELFQKYQRVGLHARQILGTGVFVRNDFTSFICGGAQVDSLEKIWAVMSECVSGGRQSDVDILREIFEYCLELVNASRTQATYSILPVNVGDRFDSDFHSEGADSRAQGRIVKIYLRGFRNDYNGRVVRKSIVQVG